MVIRSGASLSDRVRRARPGARQRAPGQGQGRGPPDSYRKGARPPGRGSPARGPAPTRTRRSAAHGPVASLSGRRSTYTSARASARPRPRRGTSTRLSSTSPRIAGFCGHGKNLQRPPTVALVKGRPRVRIPFAPPYQQILGSCSPLSMSTMRWTPKGPRHDRRLWYRR